LNTAWFETIYHEPPVWRTN